MIEPKSRIFDTEILWGLIQEWSWADMERSDQFHESIELFIEAEMRRYAVEQLEKVLDQLLPADIPAKIVMTLIAEIKDSK